VFTANIQARIISENLEISVYYTIHYVVPIYGHFLFMDIFHSKNTVNDSNNRQLKKKFIML